MTSTPRTQTLFHAFIGKTFIFSFSSRKLREHFPENSDRYKINVDEMWLCGLFFGFFWFIAIPANGIYFPVDVINITLPSWTHLPKPLPPLMTLRAADDHEKDITYGVASESTSGLFLIQGDLVKVNDEAFSAEEIGSKHQSVVISGRSDRDFATQTINLFLTGDKINCERAKRNLCFWNGASYRILENSPPTRLGQLSSHFYRGFCKNYTTTYEIFKGGDYVSVEPGPVSNLWFLTTKKEMKKEETSRIRFGVNCTVTSLSKMENFRKEFDLEVLPHEGAVVSFEKLYEVPPSNFISQNERIAAGTIRDPNGDLTFVMRNDTEKRYKLKCVPETIEEYRGKSMYECEIITRKSFQLTSSYTVYIQIGGKSPDGLLFQNITLDPVDSGLEKQSLMLSTHAEENLLLDLKYPETIDISLRAVTGTRVAEPMLENSNASTDVRKKILASRIKFEILTVGIFNITQAGGIVFVSNRQHLKAMLYRIKVSGVYPSGYRFFSTIQINVTNTFHGEDICDKTIDENLPSCSEKRNKIECEKTCGFSTGILNQSKSSLPVTSGCSWRSNDQPEKLSRRYQTCSPDFNTCPDRFCDPLEALFPKICPQDCTEYVFGSANKENLVPGIASATGICTCDNRQKCLCALVSDMPKQSDRRKAKEMINETTAPRKKEAISAVRTSYSDHCGTICLLSIITGSVILVFGMSGILLLIYRRRLKKRCLNQRPLKEDMVNINYEEYVERTGDQRPIPQSPAEKEIPEYYDKKWEFPRHRLTIEETLGEGEFGKVLKARADGIGGNEGSVTVAVKTLKDNAKDSELDDLISEYQLLKEIDHPNVIHLLGACTKSDGPLYIIIEYAKHGSLRNYLRKHRHLTTEALAEKENETSYSQTISPKDILTFAWQIAKGMSYLTEMKLVHRDLAARNILLAEGLICKISDFGLTRDIYEDDTYFKKSKGRVPVKWMALESLADHVYTTKSDVWSYGILLWELVTTGASPYPGIPGQDLFNLLKTGYRMEKPPNCSHELYQILRSCWHETPSQRPTFKTLVAKLEEMLGEGKDYLDLGPRTAENKAYFCDFAWDDSDSRQPFLEEEKDNGMVSLSFKMFDKQRCKCPVGNCECGGALRYENEKVEVNRKYENANLDSSGYVVPMGEPKPVQESANFDVVCGKEEIFNVKKI